MGTTRGADETFQKPLKISRDGVASHVTHRASAAGDARDGKGAGAKGNDGLRGRHHRSHDRDACVFRERRRRTKGGCTMHCRSEGMV